MINRIFELSLRKEIYFRKYTMKFESLETSYHSIITSPKKRSTNTFSTRVEPKISISNYSPSRPTSIPYFFNFLRVDSPLEYDDASCSTSPRFLREVASHQKFRKRDSRRTRSPCVIGEGGREKYAGTCRLPPPPTVVLHAEKLPNERGLNRQVARHVSIYALPAR